MSLDSEQLSKAASQSAASDGHIRIDDMTKTFGDGSIIACEDITLEIEQGEFVVLLGPSGCGKTTTLRCISGLEVPDSGHILVGDEDITYRKPRDRDLAFVFQNIALFPHMSVRENIRFGLDMKTDLDAKEKEAKVQSVAETLGIDEMLDRKPNELSGGQQQRVSLGRAMVIEPEAFLLDEPFSALDANLRDQMRVEIKKLQRELETAMIFVTHDQEEAMTLGDTIVVMSEAHIQQLGNPYEIYNNPTNRFVAEFIGSPSTNFIDATVSLDGDRATLTTEHFSFHLSDGQRDDLTAADGQSVSLGVRPEYLNLDRGDGLFEADVEVIEPHGARDAVHLLVDGTKDLTAVTTQNVIGLEQRTTTVDIDTEKIWLFDEAGDRVL